MHTRYKNHARAPPRGFETRVFAVQAPARRSKTELQCAEPMAFNRMYTGQRLLHSAFLLASCG